MPFLSVGWPHRAAAWGPVLILAVAAFWVWRRHAAGVASSPGDAVLLLTATLVCLLLIFSLWAFANYGPQSTAAERRQLHRMTQVTLSMGYFLALLFSGIALHLPLESPVTVALVIPWIVVAGLLWLWQPQVEEQTEPVPVTTTINRDQNYLWTGLGFYSNPDDPAPIVDKRVGWGYTFNLGNPVGRRLAAATFAWIALIVAATFVFAAFLSHR